MTHSFLYYFFFASVVLYMGIGMNRSTLITNTKPKVIFLLLIKIFCTVTISTVITMLILMHILVPLRLTFIMPFIALIVLVSFGTFIEIVLRIIARKSSSEFAVSYLIVFLALNGSISVLDAFLIPIYCILSFAIVVFILKAVTYTVGTEETYNDMSPKKGLLIFSLALIALATLVFDVTWLNAGVLP